jgi:hypothetical protein
LRRNRRAVDSYADHQPSHLRRDSALADAAEEAREQMLDELRNARRQDTGFLRPAASPSLSDRISTTVGRNQKHTGPERGDHTGC